MKRIGLIIGFISLLLTTYIPEAAADSFITAQAPKTVLTKAGSWAAVAIAAGAPASSGSSYAISWKSFVANPNSVYDFIDITNIGSLPLLQQDITINTIPSHGLIVNVTLEVCVAGTWNQTNNSCSSGNSLLLGTISTGNLTTNSTLQVNDRLSLRASTSDVKATHTRTTNISITVNRTYVRPATTTNS